MPPKESIEVALDLPGEAYIPRTYVPDMRVKIDLYRRLARVSSEGELDELASEFADRFGTPPPEVDRLALLARLRIWAHNWQVSSIYREDDFVVLRYANRKRIEQLAARSGKRLRIVDGEAPICHSRRELVIRPW